MSRINKPSYSSWKSIWGGCFRFLCELTGEDSENIKNIQRLRINDRSLKNERYVRYFFMIIS